MEVGRGKEKVLRNCCEKVDGLYFSRWMGSLDVRDAAVTASIIKGNDGGQGTGDGGGEGCKRGTSLSSTGGAGN